MALIPAELLAEAPAPERVARAKYFPPLEVNRRVRVMPLLTPDNYRQVVLDLIQNAEQSILFQNQSLNLLAENDDGFEELVAALRDRQQELDDVRIIVRGDFNPRPVLEKLQDFGFDMSKVKAQKKCHTKGIVIDSSKAVVSSVNWTNQGTMVNRDAGVVFHDAEIAEYYGKIFEFDWTHLAKAQLDEEMAPVRLATPGEEAPEGMVIAPLYDLLLGDG
jgi:phosphatidylserine/phosphatidylglycerophosphate/cardiolipin synthase-like enzyme